MNHAISAGLSALALIFATVAVAENHMPATEATTEATTADPAADAAMAEPVLTGDAEKGAAEFRKCKACHAVTAEDGTEIVKGGKTGPNLHGLIGRVVAATDFAYGDSIKAVGAAGLVWDEVELVAYLANPGDWLKVKSGDPAAKSKMAFKLAKGGADIAAYLHSVVVKP